MKIDILHMRNLAAEDYLRKSAGASIPDIDRDTLEKVRQILEKGMMQGNNPNSVALELIGRIDPATNQRTGGVLNLPKEKILEVEKARKYIEILDDTYLSLELRDKRFDRRFKKALSLKTPLVQEAINQMISAYENRVFLDYGQGITQTEMMRSLNHAKFMANKKMIDEGLIHHSLVRKEWDDVGDKRVRHTHRQLAEKYSKGKGIPLDQPFVSPSGARFLYPGDTSLGAPYNEVEKCRCLIAIRADFIGQEMMNRGG